MEFPQKLTNRNYTTIKNLIPHIYQNNVGMIDIQSRLKPYIYLLIHIIFWASIIESTSIIF